jgi:hypothetical protein
MKISTLRLLCVLLLAAPASEAQDRTCRDIAFPEHVQAAGTELTLNGLGVRKATFLRINVYVAALYVVQPSRDARTLIESETPQELILHFVRNVGADDLRKAFTEDFAHNPAAGSAAIREQVARLNGWMSDMKSGQRLVFVRSRQGVEVIVNGTGKGSIAGEEFARLLVAIWLGPTPPNAELKSGLLGGECS